MPRCWKCTQELDVDAFAKSNTRANGLQTMCRECSKKRSKEYEKNNREKLSKIRKDRIEKFKRDMTELKIKLGGCRLCNEKEPCCLDFHHLRDKIGQVSRLLHTSAWETILKEIEKCVLICSNCHRKIHKGIITLDFNKN